MASPNIFSGGLGGSSGSVLATGSKAYTSGTVYYLGSATSGASDFNPGTDRVRPLATLAQALSNATNNDIIVCLAGHTETLTAVTTIAETGLSLVGEGTGSNRPKFTRNVNDELFDVTGAGFFMDNIYFPASSTATALAKVRIASAGCIVSNCYFEADAEDDGPQLEFITGAGQCVVRACTFISTLVSTTDQPSNAITVTNAMSDLTIGGPASEDAVVLDGGTTGWAQPNALRIAGAVTRLRILNIDLLNDSDISIVTGTVGAITVRNTTGSAKVAWAA